jgi:DNA polymerase III delta subunit
MTSRLGFRKWITQKLQDPLMAPESRTVLLHGEESFLVDEAAATILNAWRSDLISDFGYEVLDSSGLNAGRLRDALLQAPFLDPHRVVAVRGLLPGRADSLAPALAAIPESTRLLVTVNGRLGTASKLAKAISALPGGRVQEHTRLKGRRLNDWAYGRARELGVSTQLAALVLRSTPPDLAVLDSELRKLASLGSELGPEQAAQLIAGGREEDIFRLTDQLLPSPGPGAWAMLANLAQAGMAPTTIAYRLARHLALVLEVKTRQERGETLSQVQAEVNAHSFVVQKAYDAARSVEAADLEAGLRVLLDYEWEVKSGQIDAAWGLEAVLAKL